MSIWFKGGENHWKNESDRQKEREQESFTNSVWRTLFPLLQKIWLKREEEHSCCVCPHLSLSLSLLNPIWLGIQAWFNGLRIENRRCYWLTPTFLCYADFGDSSLGMTTFTTWIDMRGWLFVCLETRVQRPFTSYPKSYPVSVCLKSRGTRKGERGWVKKSALSSQSSHHFDRCLYR